MTNLLRKANSKVLVAFLVIAAVSIFISSLGDDDIAVVHGRTVADFSIEENAAGFATNILTVRIKARPSETTISDVPELLFTAEPLRSLKGESAHGRITLAMTGSLAHGSAIGLPLPEVGKAYLVAARFSHRHGFYSVAHLEEIGTDGELSEERAEHWRRAINNPTPYEDIVSGKAPSRGSR